MGKKDGIQMEKVNDCCENGEAWAYFYSSNVKAYANAF